ncbi:YihY/virulence factor BrkB family protein [Phenylobacterium sp.]|uniref:YihY/virulence factor BrkB family protein n=1 Tax=Phenylobacterium sp. TaxID=1871053 RepID=UPI0025D00590|nr:YihY/virulence factor BrkB family protein [Phenylobacterium sp.]MBX3486207.1 YihY/virulence factor BrkB family protein [Phenylobacterium sp.]MCW5760279.1 YihY/virulence factor BrkB family protein [Phenylobacterium sp.]
MTPIEMIRRLRARDLDPIHAARVVLVVLGKALSRMWGRDVMLYTGGVSFFVMLAIFPAIAIVMGLYSMLSDPARVAEQGEQLARVMPQAAQVIFQGELMRLSRAPIDTVSTQSTIALLVGGYASHRGFKALLAGLSFIHDEQRQRGFLSFNLLALAVLFAALGALGLLSVVFFAFRILGETLDLRPLRGVLWLYSEWTWASAGMALAMALIYRWAMSRDPVDWRASFIGGAAASALCIFASWGLGIYVEQIAALGATYGSIATVVIFLIWLSWNVNAVFFGGALATEVELALHRRRLPLASEMGGLQAPD